MAVPLAPRSETGWRVRVLTNFGPVGDGLGLRQVGVREGGRRGAWAYARRMLGGMEAGGLGLHQVYAGGGEGRGPGPTPGVYWKVEGEAGGPGPMPGVYCGGEEGGAWACSEMEVAVVWCMGPCNKRDIFMIE